MPITANDIKLLESERMADTTDGGGRRTSRVIQDGVAGNIFPKVSRLDSVYGRVNLRKVYGAILTADVDTYAGAHAIITDAPDNAKIHTSLFATASEYDQRDAARDRIESFVTSGPESRMTLLGRQLQGQQSVVVYQRVEEPLPEVGAVLCLSAETGNVVTAQQYIRVQEVSAEIRTFTEQIGTAISDFKRRVVTIGTGTPLRYSFSGPESASQLTNVERPAKVRSTTFVDAARYYGIKPLAIDANSGELSVKVSSVYTPIVPTTTRETAVSNAELGVAGSFEPIKAGTRTEALAASSWSANVSLFTLRSIQPGSLALYSGATEIGTDNGSGVIAGSGFSGTVDYDTGTITRTGGATGGAISATYTPAVAATQIAHTREIGITLGNRGLLYPLTLIPAPAPGSGMFEYRALGKWYRLRDNGDGSVTGDDSAYGTGTIDYATGAVNLTLGALPDVDTSLLVSFGSPAHYVIRSGATTDAPSEVVQQITLANLPVLADSLSVTYTSGGVDYTATDNASGVITGNGVSGTVNYTTGQVTLRYTTRLPDALTSVAVSYTQVTATVQGEQVVKSAAIPAAGTMQLNDGVSAGSFNGTLPFASKPVYVRDNGSGLLVAPGGQVVGDIGGLLGAVITVDSVIGTINYTTGELVVNATIGVSGNTYQPPHFGTAPGTTYPASGGIPSTYLAGEYHPVANTISLTAGGNCNLGWKSSGVTTSTAAKAEAIGFAAAPLRFPLRSTIGDNIVPGSLAFTIGGKTYIDRNGTLYADVSPVNGAGTTAGTVNYESGEVQLSFWANGANLGVAVDCCLSIYGEYSLPEVFFRTAGAPLRPGSFFVQATTLDGVVLTGTSDTNGIITGTKIQGVIDQETGVVRLRFGAMVTAAGNESAYWYNAANISGGQIWKPDYVVPSTLRYNAVLLANLPLNADILGLDPVRLPSDGRVPIYRPADVAVIHNTQGFTLPNPVTTNSTYNVGRTDLAEMWLVDQNGVRVAEGNFTPNLAGGTVTMAASLSLAGLVQPLIAKHRVEDLVMITDVRINGDIEIASPLSRDYPAATTFVSSAVLFGDMNARVTNVHDLTAFGSWTDTPGAESNAEYNTIDYPVEVLNNGALTERWRISFTSQTAFQVIGENLGVIATGSTATDCAPANGLTGQPYFILRAAGWGAGWSAGNQLRFNTISAAAPIWVARTVLPGATLEGDSFSLQLRGDVDA